MLGESDADETSLLTVVELMLDMTESSVAFCWELGAGNAHTKAVLATVLLYGFA